MSLSLMLGASGGGVALLLLVTCVYLGRRRGQRVNEIVPRISSSTRMLPSSCDERGERGPPQEQAAAQRSLHRLRA